MRTLYLQKMLSMNGRDSLAGRRLYASFLDASEECLLGHLVVDSDDHGYRDPRFDSDIVTPSTLARLQPDLVYLEGGLLAGTSRWKVDRGAIEGLVETGAVVIVADVDRNEAREHRDQYRDAATLFRASIAYTRADDRQPVEVFDERSFWLGPSQVLCNYAEMAVLSDWLRPIYDDVPQVLVGLPVRLDAFADVAACGNESSTMRENTGLGFPFPEPDSAPFASVHRHGLGYLVLITGLVSADVWLDGCPHNTRWLLNLAAFLRAEVEKHRREVESPVTSSTTLFLSHRSTDKELVHAVNTILRKQGRLNTWLDSGEMIPSDSLPERIEQGLGRMTHFVIFWSAAAARSDWVTEVELPAAVERKEQVPLVIVRLDETPVPAVAGDILRIEAIGMDAQEIADSILSTVSRLQRRRGA